MTYIVLRPPLHSNFQLPSREELLKLEKGSLVKVIFQVEDESPERMWTILKDVSDADKWTGVIDNDATGKKTHEALPPGTVVKFHPLDIISIFDKNKTDNTSSAT